MSVMHPLAIVNAASVTSLVRMTPYHHSTSVHPAQVETHEGVATLGRKARDAATRNLVTQPVTAVHGVQGVKTEMTIEEAKGR